jgi:hypothetical protein
MTPDQQRIAIAEACGWTTLHKGLWVEKLQTYAALPDYLNDLNAMHEAEKVLSLTEFWDYAKNLCAIVKMDKGRESHIHATASQRAEAFLRTLNLWNPTP